MVRVHVARRYGRHAERRGEIGQPLVASCVPASIGALELDVERTAGVEFDVTALRTGCGCPAARRARAARPAEWKPIVIHALRHDQTLEVGSADGRAGYARAALHGSAAPRLCTLREPCAAL